MRRVKMSKKVVSAIVALVAAVAVGFGYQVNDGIQNMITDAACNTVVECAE